ncbi:Sphingomyelin synthase-related 2 [Caenorhabditis elegans]|uniref:Sphingomyelin synthase-related 2 n=2 Tax=Caenorhabditis elegans TaxID=6239 RepID=SMSR2_CAEEL|nr:Sphingomyelin synthase-related 2 [Caenorhabditis elegans]Q9TYV2.2 RecName: Full=Sphingomyelin synthase-related 2 [Caenorhabditis elegans]CDH93085.1 Sphingomyelin synthase-related 2 [Caenorhabditis elegans]|eukprot:NP_001293556.1 Sphingomyelin synthase-related 2 [Caenorhabditis elegans]
MKKDAENENLLHAYEHDEQSSKYFIKPDSRYSIDDDISVKIDGKQLEVRKWPTLLATAMVGVGWLSNEVALAWVHERVPDDYHPLPDLFFSHFPEIRGAIRIAEYIMMILLISALLVMFTHQHRWIVIRRVFFCIAMAYSFRALCVTIFQVPVPSINTYCAPKSNSSLELVAGRVVKMFWSAGIEQLRPRELCGDLIVSGHTLTIFTAFLVFKTYAPQRLQPLSHIYHVLAFTALFSILLARKHYMIDIVLGYTVSTRIFMEYHALAASYHNRTFETNPLAWSFWSFFIPIFECDAPANMHNHLLLYNRSTSSKNVSTLKKSRRSFE